MIKKVFNFDYFLHEPYIIGFIFIGTLVIIIITIILTIIELRKKKK